MQASTCRTGVVYRLPVFVAASLTTPPPSSSLPSFRHRQKSNHAAARASNARAEAAGPPRPPSPPRPPPCPRSGGGGRPVTPSPSRGPRGHGRPCLPIPPPSFGRKRDQHAPPCPHPRLAHGPATSPSPRVFVRAGVAQIPHLLDLGQRRCSQRRHGCRRRGEMGCLPPPSTSGGAPHRHHCRQRRQHHPRRHPFWGSLVVRGAKQHAHVPVASLKRHRRNRRCRPRKRRWAPPTPHGHRPQHLC